MFPWPHNSLCVALKLQKMRLRCHINLLFKAVQKRVRVAYKEVHDASCRHSDNWIITVAKHILFGIWACLLLIKDALSKECGSCKSWQI